MTIQSETFSSCTVTGINGVTGVSSIAVNATSTCPWTVTVDDSTNPAVVTISPATGSGCSGRIDLTIVLKTPFGPVTCVYEPSGGTIQGTWPLGTSDVTFSVHFVKVSGPGICPSSLDFSGTYMITNNGVSVIVN